jgi:hypothetical protein
MEPIPSTAKGVIAFTYSYSKWWTQGWRRGLKFLLTNTTLSTIFNQLILFLENSSYLATKETASPSTDV